MIIVSAADEKFAPHFATMLHSAWTHNRNAQFYLLDCGIAAETQRKLAHWAAGLRINLVIVPVDTAPFSDLPVYRAWSPAIYARILIPNMFPERDRALYLDADTVVTGDLTGLWETALGGDAIAGAPDNGGLYMEELRGGYVFQLKPYVNSGVLLLNLPVWRNDHLSNRVLDFVRKHPKLALPDQTAINAVCAGRITTLGVEWDFMPADNDRTLKWIEPRIIHWTGAMKPWIHKDAVFGALYLHHRSQTPLPLAAPPRKVYRSAPRILLNLVLGRPKYWYRFLMRRRSRVFTEQYLRGVVA